MDLMTYLRDALALVEGVASCKVGIEPNMTPADYPMVRIVPLRVVFAGPRQAVQQVRALEVMVHFGVAQHEFEGGPDATDGGTEALWRALFDMEARLIAALPTTGPYLAQWQDTMTDEVMPPEERNPAFKLMAMTVQVTGLV